MAISTAKESSTAAAEVGAIHRSIGSPIVVSLPSAYADAVFEVGGAT